MQVFGDPTMSQTVTVLPSGDMQTSANPSPILISRGGVNVRGVNLTVAGPGQTTPPNGHKETAHGATIETNVTQDLAAIDVMFAEMGSRATSSSRNVIDQM